MTTLSCFIRANNLGLDSAIKIKINENNSVFSTRLMKANVQNNVHNKRLSHMQSHTHTQGLTG